LYLEKKGKKHARGLLNQGEQVKKRNQEVHFGQVRPTGENEGNRMQREKDREYTTRTPHQFKTGEQRTSPRKVAGTGRGIEAPKNGEKEASEVRLGGTYVKIDKRAAGVKTGEKGDEKKKGILLSLIKKGQFIGKKAGRVERGGDSPSPE